MRKGGFGQKKLKPLAGADDRDLLPSFQNQSQDQDKEQKEDGYLQAGEVFYHKYERIK